MLAEDRKLRPRAGDVYKAVQEVERINAVFWNLQHFDKYSPFLNASVGHYGAGDIHETMKQVRGRGHGVGRDGVGREGGGVT